jgi:dihydroxyacetone kinase
MNTPSNAPTSSRPPGNITGWRQLAPADDTCRMMLDSILADLPFRSGDEVLLLVNGMGATTLTELYMMNRRAHLILERGIRVHATHDHPDEAG